MTGLFWTQAILVGTARSPWLAKPLLEGRDCLTDKIASRICRRLVPPRSGMHFGRYPLCRIASHQCHHWPASDMSQPWLLVAALEALASISVSSHLVTSSERCKCNENCQVSTIAQLDNSKTRVDFAPLSGCPTWQDKAMAKCS